MIYITGDTHGDFSRLYAFCQRFKTTREDIMIILGDAGFNFFGGQRDTNNKHNVSELPITVFSIHGNHEMRPATLPSYRVADWHDGKVYVEDAYPNLLFAMDGEVYNLDGIQTIVIGGAYSVDKFYRLANGWNWWADEQPSDAIKQKVESTLTTRNWHVDAVLSHTTPLKYVPTEVFLTFIDQRLVDKTTEIWLDSIEDRLIYKHWYAGHFHTEKDIDRLTLLFGSIREFKAQTERVNFTPEHPRQ